MFPFIPPENLWFSGDFWESEMGHIGQKWINLMPSDGPTQKRSMNKSKLVIISSKKGRLVVSLLYDRIGDPKKQKSTWFWPVEVNSLQGIA